MRLAISAVRTVWSGPVRLTQLRAARISRRLIVRQRRTDKERPPRRTTIGWRTDRERPRGNRVLLAYLEPHGGNAREKKGARAGWLPGAGAGNHPPGPMTLRPA